MEKQILLDAIEELRGRYHQLDWTYHDYPKGGPGERIHRWPGNPNEDIMVCIHGSSMQQESFHRHDYFYFNYTYRGQYESLSGKYNRRIEVKEGELYAGQPLAGHAISAHDDQTTIVMVLIKKGSFFHEHLPMLSANSDMFHFLLNPQVDAFSNEHLHFKIDDDCNTRALLQMMIVDYAFPQNDTPEMLRSLTLSFLMQIARQYLYENQLRQEDNIASRIVRYIGRNSETVTLNDLSQHFSYHPNYISSLLASETGKTFSQILLEERMKRAVALLRGTDFSVSDIALMIGYRSTNNFYKAFKRYYEMSPRTYIDQYPGITRV